MLANLLTNNHRKEQIDTKTNEDYNWSYANGRRYASTELGHYYMPNDEPEIHRLNDQHRNLTQVKGGKLHNAPIQDLKVDQLRILDIGCGSGIWCIQMAEDYPHAKITGMDVSPIQPENKPENVDWAVGDMEKGWPFADDEFDLVHLSLVHGCVTNWDAMMKKIVKYGRRALTYSSL